MRVGIGFDIHPLVEGRRLVLGGVAIDYERGAAGHSDGDVLLHAIIDALFGAAGLGDIGEHFPDTDLAYRGADSANLMREAVQRVRTAGFTLVNIDANVIAEAPKLGPLKEAMGRRIAELLDVDPSRVSVKAKTAEGLGPIGRGEAIAAEVVVLIQET